MMATIDDNDNLYKMVFLGVISQAEAEAQYPKIQELAVKLEAKESSLMCAIAYFTTHGWDFAELLNKIDNDTAPWFFTELLKNVDKTLSNSLLDGLHWVGMNEPYEYFQHFEEFDVARIKEAVRNGSGE